MRRTLYLLYGIASYALFLGVFLYAVGFLGNLVVPRTLDSDAPGPLGVALAVNLGLAAVFALQHSGMARPAFKRWWTRYVPEPIERSTYVLASNLCMIVLFWLWQPIGGTVWSVESPLLAGLLLGVYGLGWLIVLLSTFQLDHFDLFGLRQVVLHFRGKPYAPIPFRVPLFYRHVRHPLYVGWLLVFWAAPTMSVTHVVLSAIITVYILVAIRFEERDLVDGLGEDYERYRADVPMLVPGMRPRARRSALGSAT